MVIDLSSGANSSKYPVSYLDAVPSGGWSDEYKTTKLVLRKCLKGKDPKGRYTLTKGFYIGVFEVTCKQYYLVMGSWPSGHGESDACQPAEYITWNMARGNNWPGNTSPAANSFTGKLKSRTGLLADLPTEAQWEYACRAGTTSSFNNGGNDEADLKKVGRYYGNSSGTYNGQQGNWSSAVGSYKANAWGIYDMHGNLWELCLDWYGNSTPSGTDPKGPSSGIYRVSKGGSYYAQWNSCTSSSRIEGSTGYQTYEDGFRVCVTLSE
jgi:formylglycine-generating enzyme required for sulfatase activity